MDMDFYQYNRYCGVKWKGEVPMKQKTGKTKDEILAFRVEILDSQWQENKTPEERIIQQKVNERLDGWLKQISGEQRDGIEDCIDDMLEENWECQLYLYEEGVKDGIRLMKMIYGLWIQKNVI